jgi:hypothetical protein
MDKEFINTAISGIVPTAEMSESACNARVESLYAKAIKANTHYKDRRSWSTPHFILLFLDEVDKADRELMKALNSLLSDGTMDGRGSNPQYKIEKDTRMIIIMTANFGSDEIVHRRLTNAPKHVGEVYQSVKQDMVKQGYQPNEISRMGTLVPCLPPLKEDLVVVLIRKVFDYIFTPNVFTRKYTQPKFKNDDLITFVEYIMDRCDPYEGVRNACALLDDILNGFTKRILAYYDKYNLANDTDIKKILSEERPTIYFGSKVYTGIDTYDDMISDPRYESIHDDDESKSNMQQALESKRPIAELALSQEKVLEYDTYYVLKPITGNGKPKLTVFEENEEQRRILNLLEEYAIIHEDSKWILAKDVLKFLHKEIDSVSETQLAQPNQHRFINKPEVEQLMQKLTIDTTTDTKIDHNNMIIEERDISKNQKSKRKRGDLDTRECYDCLETKDIHEFRANRYKCKRCESKYAMANQQSKKVNHK